MGLEVQTQFLVVGAGPAGLGLASFLGKQGRYSTNVMEVSVILTRVCRARGTRYFQGVRYRGHS